MGAPSRQTAVTQEILRQASVALGGRPVMLWEAVAPDRFEPRASSDPRDAGGVAHVDLSATIERWKIPVPPRSRWVGSRAWPEGPWVIAPVRSRTPAPPPDGRERRSRERITLELVGLCLGLGERLERPDPLAELATLPAMIAHEVSNPLAAANAGLQLAMEAMGQRRDVDAARRLESFLRAIQDRARGG